MAENNYPGRDQLAPATVVVPASTSNLGAGFDCIGLAINRYLRASYHPGPDPLRIQLEGQLTCLGTESANGEELLSSVFGASVLEWRGIEATGVLRAHSEIPLGRGLGASGAAVVAGLMLAAWATGHEATSAQLLQQAARWEGHPDNAAPSLLGGLVGVAQANGGRYQAFPLPLSRRIGFAFAAPGAGLATLRARSVLPAAVPFGEAANSLGRMAALLQGLSNADSELLRLGFNDRLHVPHRLPLIPGAPEAVAAAEAAGAWAATLSGSGSGILAVCAPEQADTIADAMGSALRGEGVVAFSMQPDTEGARREDG